MGDTKSAEIQLWIDRVGEGDPAARAQLLHCAAERLRRLTRKLLRGYPGVRRWEETDDILQGAMMRLCRALGSVSPRTAREFIGLAATQIRRELIDLSRHYYGPTGLGAHHDSRPRAVPQDDSHCDPGRLAEWTEFHERVAELPAEDREIFDLLYYQGLPQEEAAGLLGVSERTVKRRWRSAKLKVARMLKDDPPGS